jgi:hypothetical protein
MSTEAENPKRNPSVQSVWLPLIRNSQGPFDFEDREKWSAECRDRHLVLGDLLNQGWRIIHRERVNAEKGDYAVFVLFRRLPVEKTNGD